MSQLRCFIALFYLFLCGCNADTELSFEVIGTGFSGAKFDSVSVTCKTTGSITGWSSDLKVRRHVLDRVKLSASVEVPKNESLNCSLGGDEFSQLPYIPIYNNSQKSRFFKILGPTKVQVRVHRKTLTVDDEKYTHIMFKKFDHVTNKKIVIEKELGRSVSNVDNDTSENWLE